MKEQRLCSADTESTLNVQLKAPEDAPFVFNDSIDNRILSAYSLICLYLLSLSMQSSVYFDYDPHAKEYESVVLQEHQRT